MSDLPERLPIGGAKRAVATALGWLAAVPRTGCRLFSRGPRARRVLLLEPFGLGDVLSHQPLARTLLAEGFQVACCGREAFRELLPPEVQWIPSRIPWGLHDYAKKYRAGDYLSREFREFLRELRASARGAVGVDTRGDVRGVWLLHLAGCARVVTLDHYLDSDLAMPALAGERVPFDFTLRRWELNLQFLPRLGIPLRQVEPPRLSRPPEGAGLDAVARKTALIPVAPWDGKLWPAQNWRGLVNALRGAGHEPCGLCGPGQTAAAQAQLGEGVPIREQRSIAEWVSALGGVRAVISVDTGPMHLADALGVPLVALYGVGRLPLWSPSAPRSRALHHQGDADFRQLAPTPANATEARSFLARITVAEVLAALGQSPSR